MVGWGGGGGAELEVASRPFYISILRVEAKF